MWDDSCVCVSAVRRTISGLQKEEGAHEHKQVEAKEASLAAVTLTPVS